MKGIVPFSESSKADSCCGFPRKGFRLRERLVPAPHPSQCGAGVGELPKSAGAGKARIVSDSLEIIA